MIYVELNGRIGNYLFQIAAAATLAKKNFDEFAVVCHEHYQLGEPDNCTIYEYIQQFKNNLFRNIAILNSSPAECLHFQQEGYLYKPIKYCNNIYLRGTFQSEKYFDQELIRELFRIPQSLKDRLFEKYGHLLSRGVTSINVRRGDYLNRPHEYNIASMDFFHDAINRIGRNSYFLVISDDIRWCRKHFKGPNYFFAEKSTPSEDLYLQSLCMNNIISNSTFSWWGAWLNESADKAVIVPKPWYGKSLVHLGTQDLLPESWIQISNQMPFKMRLRADKIRTRDFLRPKYYACLKKLGYA